MNASQSGPGEARKPRLLLVASLLIGVFVISLSIMLLRRHEAGIEPPAFDTTGLSSRVVNDIEAARRRIAESPQSADAWGKLGMILIARQLEPQAHICLERARELAPGEFLWPYLLGVSLAVSDPQQSVEKLRVAVELRADAAVAHVRLGELLLELNQLDSARTHLEVALQQDPDDLHALIARARLALAQDDIASAQQFGDKAEGLAPRVRAVHEIQAQIYQRRGDRQAALRALDLAGKLPNVPLPYNDPYASQVLALRRDTQQDLTKVGELLASQQFTEAIDLLRNAWREHPSDPNLPCELARVHAQINQFDMAHAVLEKAADQHPNSAHVRLQQGVLYYLRAEYQTAARCFREAADRKPDHILANFYLGKSLDKLGRTDDAISALRITVRLQPTHAEAHTDLGRLLLDQGHHAEALNHLAIALQMTPDDEKIQELHARAIETSISAAAKSKSADAAEIKRPSPE